MSLRDPERYEGLPTPAERSRIWNLIKTLHGIHATPEQAVSEVCEQFSSVSRMQALEFVRYAYQDFDKQRERLMTRKGAIDWSVQGRRLVA